MIALFSEPRRVRATRARLGRRRLPGLRARTSAAARVAAFALASLLAVCASAPPASAPVALAATVPWTWTFHANPTAAGLLAYRALTQPGASPGAGDPSLAGAILAQFTVLDSPLIQVHSQVVSDRWVFGISIACRVATASGPVSRNHNMLPLTNTVTGHGGVTSDTWYPDEATLVALRQGACYIVVSDSEYPNGAAAGQIVEWDQATQQLTDLAPDQLVARWALDDGSGTTVGHAITAGTQPGTLVGGASWTAGATSSAERWVDTGQSYGWQGGNPNWPCCLGNGRYAITPSAVSFSGTGTAQLPLTNLLPPAANQAQSLAFWLQVPQVPSSPSMALALTNPSVPSGIKIGFLNGQFGAWRFRGRQLVAVAPPTPNVWHHVVYTFDGTSRHCLVVDETSTCASATPQTAVPTSFTVGSTAGKSEFLVGSVADVRLYSQVIPPTLIATLQRHGPSSSSGCTTCNNV